MNRAGFVVVVLLQSACPAYVLSGLASPSGREVYATRPAEPEARLRCEGQPCTEVEIIRPYSIEHSGPAFLALFGLEGAGAGIAFLNVSRVLAESEATLPGQARTNRAAAFGVAGGVLALGFLADAISGGVGLARGKFSRAYQPFEIDARHYSADWRGAPVQLSLQDFVLPGAAQVPAAFSVAQAGTRMGVILTAEQKAQLEKYKPRSGDKLAVLRFTHPSNIAKDRVLALMDSVNRVAVAEVPQLLVVGTENLDVLAQAAGKSLEQCEGQCAVETGRNLGVEVVVTGQITTLGARWTLSLALSETKNGSLVGSVRAVSRTEDLADQERKTEAAARELFASLKAELAR